MAGETLLTASVAPGAYASATVNCTVNGSDTVNDNYIVVTGNDLILAHNLSGAGATITLTSTDCPEGYSGTITAHAIGDTEMHMFGPMKALGWGDGDGHIIVSGSHANLKLIAVTLP